MTALDPNFSISQPLGRGGSSEAGTSSPPGRREGGLGGHLLGGKGSAAGSGRRGAPRRRGAGWTGSHRAVRGQPATQTRTCGRLRWSSLAPGGHAPRQELTRRRRARAPADRCGHVHTHGCTRAAKSSETSGVGTERCCDAQTLFPATFTRTHTCAHLFKSGGLVQGDERRAAVSGVTARATRAPPPGKAPKGCGLG